MNKKDFIENYFNLDDEDMDSLSVDGYTIRRLRPIAKTKTENLNSNPHYSDSYFKKERTIYGKPNNNLEYVYSDRLYQWDYEKASESWIKAEEKYGNEDTVRKYEFYLSEYYNKQVEINHIIAGVNASNGFPYQAFGFRFVREGK